MTEETRLVNESETSARAIAFYLPQFHPTPENDEWWGKGFTEWTNVARATPRFLGHYQPHVPTDLGFYDLRLPEAREAQATLAKNYGVSGFCYYHYWFSGRRPLSTVEELILSEGKPSTPFIFCWANESWTRSWDGQSEEVLLEQSYSIEDDDEHFAYLLPFFEDPRYIRVGGKPLFLVYRPQDMPDPGGFAERWRKRAREAGLAGIHIAGVEAHTVPVDPRGFGFDSTIGFLPVDPIPYEGDIVIERFDDEVVDYPLTVANVVKSGLVRPWPFAPAVTPRWDNTPRRKTNARIYANASPEVFEDWVTHASEASRPLDPSDSSSRFVFVVAWNEWAEGNHIEPDERFGHRFGDALRDGLARANDRTLERPKRKPETHPYSYSFTASSHLENVIQLLGVPDSPGSVVLDLGAGFSPIADELVSNGWEYVGVEIDPVSIDALRNRALDVIEVDLASPSLEDMVLARLGRRSLGVVLLLDVLEHVVHPKLLLDSVYRLCKPAKASLVLSVPNVTHFDVALAALVGRWRYAATGLLDVTHLRFFDRETLTGLLAGCGFFIERSIDFSIASVDPQIGALLDELPIEVVNVLDTLARTANPSSHVRQFIWRVTAGVIPSHNVGEVSGLILPNESVFRVDEIVDQLRRRSTPRSGAAFAALRSLERRVEEQNGRLEAYTKELEARAEWAFRLAAERDQMTTWAQDLAAQNESLRAEIEGNR